MFYRKNFQVLLMLYGTQKGARKRIYSTRRVFMTLIKIKNGGAWDFLVTLFKIELNTFQPTVIKYANLVAVHACHIYADCLVSRFSKDKLRCKNVYSINYPYAKYATDVIFQQRNHPSGSLQNGKLFYSGKHRLYRWKSEVTVLLNAIDVNHTSP